MVGKLIFFGLLISAPLAIRGCTSAVPSRKCWSQKSADEAASLEQCAPGYNCLIERGTYKSVWKHQCQARKKFYYSDLDKSFGLYFGRHASRLEANSGDNPSLF